jgi:hypothetical protein
MVRPRDNPNAKTLALIQGLRGGKGDLGQSRDERKEVERKKRDENEGKGARKNRKRPGMIDKRDEGGERREERGERREGKRLDREKIMRVNTCCRSDQGQR